MSSEQWVVLPPTLVVRELRYSIVAHGCRTREITLVTTLLDAKQYPAADLAELYGKRWQVETNLRHLKQTLHIDVLRTKSVDGWWQPGPACRCGGFGCCHSGPTGMNRVCENDGRRTTRS